MPTGSLNKDDEMRRLLGSDKRPATSGKLSEAKQGKIPGHVTKAFTEYDRAKAELEQYRQRHPEVIERWSELQKNFDKAERKVKDVYADNTTVLGDSYNGFSVTRRRTIDAAKLVDKIPDTLAYVKVSIKNEDFDDLVSSGVIPSLESHQFEVETEVIVKPRS